MSDGTSFEGASPKLTDVSILFSPVGLSAFMRVVKPHKPHTTVVSLIYCDYQTPDLSNMKKPNCINNCLSPEGDAKQTLGVQLIFL